jgi:hypothetical protein
MDIQQDRYFEGRINGVAEPFKRKGSIRSLLPQLMIWLHQNRSGDVTIRISTTPIEHDVVKLATIDGAPLPPEPLESDDWDSYYLKLIEFFDGAESMAEYLANDAFERPQHPWLGDTRAARFIHMNASVRLYERADPTEYAELASYVERKYPTLFDSISKRG